MELAEAGRPRSRVASPHIIARAGRHGLERGFCVSQIARSYLETSSTPPKLKGEVLKIWIFLIIFESILRADFGPSKIFENWQKKVDTLGVQNPQEGV